LDQQDSTFQTVPGLAKVNGVSFQSVNFPGFYLRHANGRLQLTSISTSLDRSDATFFVRNGLNGIADQSFESFNFPGFYIRHDAAGHLWVQQNDGSSTFAGNASFAIVPANFMP
jgi:hypothetical protein